MVTFGCDMVDGDTLVVPLFTQVARSDVEMLGTGVIVRVFREEDGSHVVVENRQRIACCQTEPQVIKELAQPLGLSCCVGQR